jgi:hypothetical protein
MLVSVLVHLGKEKNQVCSNIRYEVLQIASIISGTKDILSKDDDDGCQPFMVLSIVNHV